MFRMLAWAVDHSFNVEDEWDEETRSCDVMIAPNVKQAEKNSLSKFSGINQMHQVYNDSRKAALEAVPKIKALIAKYEREKVIVTK